MQLRSDKKKLRCIPTGKRPRVSIESNPYIIIIIVLLAVFKIPDGDMRKTIMTI